MAKSGDVRIGLSGWTYPPWRGHFYPEGLVQKRELAYAASVFRSLEVNGTFYGLQKPESFARWADETPDGFVFAVKAPRYITHVRRLQDPAGPLANFLASGVLRLGARLGPVLWQLPPNFRFDRDRLEPFLAMLPHDTEAAAALAARHEGRMEGRAWTRTDARRPLRHALEIRHESFRDPAFVALLRRHRVALVCADTVEWPRLMDLTADFVYCRLHGSTELYRSAYGPADLRRWHDRIRAWSAGRPMADGDFAGRGHGERRPRDVHVYFDNTDKRHAPDDARALERLVTGAAPGARPFRR
ncbi:hypothetical protein STVA_45810 [Allostella vacuolata]|nr:hypothetical protein STVA_45810 [Stella vacuolata]